MAIRSLIDWRAGAQPDPRILMSHRTDSRSIAVMVLLDLSQSLNDVVPGTHQTRLALSTEAVAVLAWGEAPKARLSTLQGQYSTRMGPALRHAAHYLGAQTADKKLLLVLDTRQAVQELAQQGIHSHCISLDPQADAYVHDIFGQHATVVDRIDQVPERLTRLLVSLTR